MMSAASMIANAIASLCERTGAAFFWSGRCCTSDASSEQPGGPDQQHDRHHDEDHRVGCLGEEHLGQALDQAEREAGDDRSHDRAHAADDHHREHHDDEVRPHLRAHVVDRRGHHAGERRERDAEAVGQSDQARHIDAEGPHQGRVLGGGAQIGAELGALDHEPGGEAHHEREYDHPAAIDR